MVCSEWSDEFRTYVRAMRGTFCIRGEGYPGTERLVRFIWNCGLVRAQDGGMAAHLHMGASWRFADKDICVGDLWHNGKNGWSSLRAPLLTMSNSRSMCFKALKTLVTIGMLFMQCACSVNCWYHGGHRHLSLQSSYLAFIVGFQFLS